MITTLQGGLADLMSYWAIPPWERIKLQEKEWFAMRAPDIASIPSAQKRSQKIRELDTNDPILAAEYKRALRKAEAETALIRACGRFNLTGGGDVNTYAVFTETAISIVSPKARIGLIVPSAIASTLAYQSYFSSIVESGRLASFYDFENKKNFFQGVHSSYRFCLLTIREESDEPATCGFMLHKMTDIVDDSRAFSLRKSDLSLFNPNTRALPTFRTRRDAALVRHIYRSVPVLVNDVVRRNPWGVDIYRMIDANESGDLLRDDASFQYNGDTPDESPIARTDEGEVWLRVFEGKMIDRYNHRHATSYTEQGGQRSGKAIATEPKQLLDPLYNVGSRYWIRQSTVEEKLPSLSQRWIVSFMDVRSPTNIRTMVPAIIPFAGATKSLRLIRQTSQNSGLLAALFSNWASLIFDYVTRQSISGLHLSEHIVKQLPTIPPNLYTTEHLAFLLPRILELSYTSWDLHEFALDCGYLGPPFRWNDDRRFLMQCEIDAVFFHLYLGTKNQWIAEESEVTKLFATPHEAVEHVLESFLIMKKRDIKNHSDYRTKSQILEIFDAMQQAVEMDRTYQTPLEPPPGDGRAAHPESTRPNWARI